MKRILLSLACLAAMTLTGCAKTPASAEQAPAPAEASKGTEAVQPNEALPTIYDFSAVWCGPCRIFAPIFHEVAEEYAGRINFVTVDIDRQPDMAQFYRIKAVPTVIVVSPDSSVLGVRQGLMDKEEFKALIKATLNL